MCWIIPLIVGIISAILGYLLGKKSIENSPTLIRLREEKDRLHRKLESCETQKSELIREVNEATPKASNNGSAIASFHQAGDAKTINDSDVKAHRLYETLAEKYDSLKQQNDVLTQEMLELKTNTDNTNLTVDDQAIEDHPQYVELLEKYEQTENSYRQLKESSKKEQTLQIDQLKTENETINDALNQCQQTLFSIQKQEASASARNSALSNEIIDLREDNQRLKQQLKSQGNPPIDEASPVASFASLSTTDEQSAVESVFDKEAAKAVFGKRIKADDLTLIEGIGPKISQLFHNAGIDTWRKLSETPVEDCQKILSDAGERFVMHNPGTWPRQAKLAADGNWQALFDWQAQLDGGRE